MYNAHWVNDEKCHERICELLCDDCAGRTYENDIGYYGCPHDDPSSARCPRNFEYVTFWKQIEVADMLVRQAIGDF